MAVHPRRPDVMTRRGAGKLLAAVGGLTAMGTALLSAGCSSEAQRDHRGAHVPRALPLGRPVRMAWVLGSGGPRGFVHVGVLRALDELGLVPDLIVGASVGALVGCLRAAGLSARDIESLALRVQPWQVAGVAWGADASFQGGPLAQWVRDHSPVDRLEAMPLAAACVALRLPERTPVAFTAGDVGLAVQASAAIEGRFTPVQLDGVHYVDPDWAAPLPVRLARQLGAQRVLAVDASVYPDRRPEGAESYLAEDLRKAALVEADATLADLVLKPDIGYWAGLSRAYRERVIDAGYRTTLASAQSLRALHDASP